MIVVLVMFHLFSLTECQMEGFVVNGQAAILGDFPHSALLSIQCAGLGLKPPLSWRCGSSILNQDLLLTAAHCLSPKRCTEIFIAVTVGHIHRLKGVSSSAYSYVLHENFDSDFTSDIALVRVKTPLELGPRVSRVALMVEPPYGEEAEIAGWGRISPINGSLPDILQFTKLYVWRRSKCLELMDEHPRRTFCAGSKDNSYVLYGDSGSALVVRGYIQIGICSYLKPEKSLEVSVFTDVGRYYDWIQANAYDIMCEEEEPWPTSPENDTKKCKFQRLV